MSAGEITILELIKWDWFCSCTVATRGASDVFLKKKAFALIRMIANFQHVHFRKVPWALRLESGVDPLHRHFHFLIGSLPHKGRGERFRAMGAWTHILGSTADRLNGTCRVRLYEGESGLSSYLSKQLNAAESRAWGEGLVMVSNWAYRLAFERARDRRPCTMRRDEPGKLPALDRQLVDLSCPSCLPS